MKIKITTDMLIGVGLCIALVIALVLGSSTEICVCIASNLGCYMGRSLMSEHTNSSAPNVKNVQENPVKEAKLNVTSQNY